MLIAGIRIGIIYASINLAPASEALQLLGTAVQNFIAVIPEDPRPDVLWSISYSREPNISVSPSKGITISPAHPASSHSHSQILQLPDIPPGLALEDDLLRSVRTAWEHITGESGGMFMQFAEREGMGNEGEEEYEV